jgi:hypothetical protein
MAVTIKPEQAFAYAEILEILDYMEEEYVNKIPQKLIKVIKENASDTYERHLDANVPLEEQEISEKTTAILAMLMLNYWCESPEQKQELTDMFNENERKYQEELQRKYDPNNIFNNDPKPASVETKVEPKVESKVETKVEQTSQEDVLESNDVNPSVQVSTLVVENVEINSENLPMDYTNYPWYKKIATKIQKGLYGGAKWRKRYRYAHFVFRAC